MQKPELLMPAGNMEKLKMALLYGADAVYLGGKNFGLRALGGNFTPEEMAEGIKFAHSLQKKVYVTVNIFPHNGDIDKLPDYLRQLRELKADAALVADLGIFSLARKIVPELPLHISTQANNTNWATVDAWQQMGAERVVLARELSLSEIKEIRRRCRVELEMFVHGAMCISYSGRCLLSNYFTGRDANRGACAQACRWRYHLVEETRPGQYYTITEDERGTYIFNSKDLCLLPYLPELINCGIESLKVEGRMKSIHYAASIAKVYREAIDSYCDNPGNFKILPHWQEELGKVSHREYTTGFTFGRPDGESQIYGSSSYIQSSDFVGLVLEYDSETGFALVEQRNNMKCGQEIEIFQPQGTGFRQILQEMYNDEDERIEVAPHPQQHIRIKMDRPVQPWTILRRDV